MFTILIDIATVLVCALAVSGCGQEQAQVVPAPAPDATVAAASANAPVVAQDPADPVASPTATPTPNPTVVSFGFNDVTICDAFRTWDPNTTTIEVATTAGASAIYIFSWQGAFIANADGSNPIALANTAVPSFTITKSTIYATACVITVTNGQYAGVTP